MLFSVVSSFVKGNVKAVAENGFSERFISLCHERKIPLKNVDISLSSVNFEVEHKYIADINKIASTAGMSLSLISQRGLPYLINRGKIRFGLPVGMILAIAVFCVISSVVWSVEIQGCEQIDKNVISDILCELGVKRGAFTFNIDCKNVSSTLESSDERIYSTAVNIEGCKVFVGIKEKNLPERVIGTDIYSNIVAKYGGEIVEVDVYAGESQVRAGNSVVKGDLLVNGVQTGKNGEIIFADSQADIIARTSHVISCDSSGVHNVNVIGKIRDLYSIYFFGLCFLPDAEQDSCSVSRNEYFADTDSTVFPVGFVRQRHTYFNDVPREFSPEMGKLICLYDLATATAEQIGEKNVVEQKIELSAEKAKVEAVYICEENIAEKKYIQVINK